MHEFKHPKYYAEMRAEKRKLQATSFKPRVTSFKLQAGSCKLQDPGTTIHLNKFRGPRTMGLGYDESVLRMCLMECNLMCRKF